MQNLSSFSTHFDSPGQMYDMSLRIEKERPHPSQLEAEAPLTPSCHLDPPDGQPSATGSGTLPCLRVREAAIETDVWVLPDLR